MTDRKKLMDILIDAKRTEPEGVAYSEWLVDCLLANGVTFAKGTDADCKWKPASEPPEVWRDKNGTLVNYLVYMPGYGVDVGNYMEPAKTWLCVGIPCKVTHWMPMPEPPEGREDGR